MTLLLNIIFSVAFNLKIKVEWSKLKWFIEKPTYDDLSIELQTDQGVNGQWIGGSRGKDWGMLSKPCQPRVGVARQGEIDGIHIKCTNTDALVSLFLSRKSDVLLVRVWHIYFSLYVSSLCACFFFYELVTLNVCM